MHLMKWLNSFESTKEIIVREMYSSELLYKGSVNNVPKELTAREVEHVASLRGDIPVFILKEDI